MYVHGVDMLPLIMGRLAQLSAAAGMDAMDLMEGQDVGEQDGGRVEDIEEEEEDEDSTDSDGSSVIPGDDED